MCTGMLEETSKIFLFSFTKSISAIYIRGLRTCLELIVQSIHPQSGTRGLSCEPAPTTSDPLPLLFLMSVEFETF